MEWETRGESLEQYVKRIAQFGWGGAVEMVCCALSKGVNVHVYEKSFSKDSFERFPCHDVANASHTIHMLHQGSSHYDNLELH